MHLNDGKNYIRIDNMLVERDALGIAERIKEYDPDLILICADPNDVQVTTAPFMVVWHSPRGTYEKVLEAWTLDATILERLYNADQHRFDTLVTLEQWETRNRKMSQDRYQEKRDESMDLVVAIAKNRKSSFTFKKDDDLVRINEIGPVTRNKLKKSF